MPARSIARLLMLPMVDRLKLYSSKEQGYLDEKAHRLATLRKKLITAYFPGIEPSLILQEIEHLRFTEFPQLQYILRQIFSVATHPGITEIPPELVDWIKPANYPDKHFQDLNSKYGYFSVEVLANATAIFDALKPLCRKMTSLIERQADDSEMAYKLMALCCLNEDLESPLNTHKCFEKIAITFDKLSGSTKRPYHDVFVVGLESFPRASDANDIKQWHRFIQNNGFHALPFCADCKSFDTVPKTLQEAKETQFKKIYPRAAENTAFARFCKVFRIDNEGFEAGLDFITSGWPKKDSDNLPLVDIRLIEDGNEYRWVKLPTNDLSALYLGNMIPGCCQFINGHSRQCVIDGTSLTDNGFYVLLKKKIKTGHDEHKEDSSSSLEMDGDIIAQSYAWISQNGNLCLDSIEWDNRRIKEAKLKEIMDRFSAQVLDENRQIHYVNVGTGGQTPANFSHRAIISEKQRQGTQYGDSFEQYCLASRVHPDQIEKLQTKLQEFDEDFSRNFLYLAGYLESIDEIGNIEEIEGLLTKTFFQPFPAIHKTLTRTDFRALTFEEYQQLDEPEKKQISTFCKKLNTQKFRNFLEWLPEIPDSERLDFVKQEVKGIDSSSVYEGSVLYVLAARNPQYLMDVLHLIPEQDRLGAVKQRLGLYGETILHFSANKPQYLRLMLPLIPEQDRLAALIGIPIFDRNLKKLF